MIVSSIKCIKSRYLTFSGTRFIAMHLRMAKRGRVKLPPVYFGSYDTYKKHSNGYPHVSKVKEFNEAILYIVCCKRKSEIQDGGSQRGILISQPVHNVVARFQQLYIWVFFPLILHDLMRLFFILCEASGTPRWGSQKQDILISQPVNNVL